MSMTREEREAIEAAAIMRGTDNCFNCGEVERDRTIRLACGCHVGVCAECCATSGWREVSVRQHRSPGDHWGQSKLRGYSYRQIR